MIFRFFSSKYGNAFCAIIYAICALLQLFYVKSTCVNQVCIEDESFNVYNYFFNKTTEQMQLQSTTSINIVFVNMGILWFSAVGHFIGFLYIHKYDKSIWPRVRFLENAVADTMIVTVLSMICGINEFRVFIPIIGLNVCANLMMHIQEKTSEREDAIQRDLDNNTEEKVQVNLHKGMMPLAPNVYAWFPFLFSWLVLLKFSQDYKVLLAVEFALHLCYVLVQWKCRVFRMPSFSFLKLSDRVFKLESSEVDYVEQTRNTDGAYILLTLITRLVIAWFSINN